MEQGKREIFADNRRRLKQLFRFEREPVNAGGEHGLHRGGNLDALDGFGKPIISPLADQDVHLDQCSNALFQEERSSLRCAQSRDL